MNNIEKELNKMKKDLENIEVPDELESVLRQALDKEPKKRKFNYKALVAAAAIAIFFIGYNADALAYYGKKLIGYESVMNGTLNELNKLGKGQIIDKSYTFSNGSSLTLDAIMIDDNNLVVFYSFYNPQGIDDDTLDFPSVDISGPKGFYSGGGGGQISKDGKEMKWVMTYEAPKSYSQDLKMTFTSSDGDEDGQIDFRIDKTKAMGKNLKINIGKEIQVSGRKIRIKSLVASPISTRIQGNFQNIFRLALDQIRDQRVNFESIQTELLADGKIVEVKSSSMSTNLKGSYFDISFDALPKDTKEIELKLISLGANESVNKKIQMDKDEKNKNIRVLEEGITINKIYEEKGNTYVSITSEENLYLTSVYLNIDGEKTNLANTIEDNSDNQIENKNPSKVLRRRTMEFKGRGENLELQINKLRYNKNYDKIIYFENLNK